MQDKKFSSAASVSEFRRMLNKNFNSDADLCKKLGSAVSLQFTDIL